MPIKATQIFMPEYLATHSKYDKKDINKNITWRWCVAIFQNTATIVSARLRSHRKELFVHFFGVNQWICFYVYPGVVRSPAYVSALNKNQIKEKGNVIALKYEE